MNKILPALLRLSLISLLASLACSTFARPAPVPPRLQRQRYHDAHLATGAYLPPSRQCPPCLRCRPAHAYCATQAAPASGAAQTAGPRRSRENSVHQ